MNIIHENNVISVRELTPINAAKILDSKNLSNRNINNDRISEYSEAMKAGEWQFNGDPIRFTSDGILSDGQHRLTAVVRSGLPQTFLVIENMEKETRLTLDAGKVRNGGDTLAINLGVKSGDAGTISGAIKLYAKYGNAKGLSTGRTQALTNTQVAYSYKKNQSLITECLTWIKENTKIKGSLLPRCELLFIMMVTYERSKLESIDFLNMFFNCLNISETCPESLLTQYLLEINMKTRKVTQNEKLCTCIKTWNVIRYGDGAKRLTKVMFITGRDEFKKAI